jgi:IS5 family transposase
MRIREGFNNNLQEMDVKMSAGTIVDATIMTAPSSTKNQNGERDWKMHQTNIGNERSFGIKADSGVDADLK